MILVTGAMAQWLEHRPIEGNEKSWEKIKSKLVSREKRSFGN